ncbi:ribosome maturation factor RimM [Sphingomicrobium nitratireducens]|uniref:ribosome maturation factor RimM n=1 Tax=Sphingomicrobium nitratireducens TaxID=2964666 RepID=UPI00223FCBB0|nr:ribosome maturation factor RimM [Sphingomicrobium nitratireducens]
MRSPATEKRAKRVALAAVAGAHGVKGELRLKLFAEGLDTLAAQQHVFVGETERKLVSVRPGGKVAIARLEGVGDRSAAEALRGSLVEIDRGALPPLEEGEYYHADLIGLPVVDTHGEAVGHVVAVDNYGASDVVEIEKATGKRFMVPLTDNAVPEWDAERLVVNADFVD